MANKKHAHVITELDSIAQSLEKTGNTDLATMVDQATFLLQEEEKPARRQAAAKPSKPAAKPSKGSAARNARRRRTAAKGASRTLTASKRLVVTACVAELHDIGRELLASGNRSEARKLLKMAKDVVQEIGRASCRERV